jgi:hypothetical protein
MDKFIIIENYNIVNKYIKYLEQNAYILFNINNNLNSNSKNILTIFINEENFDYFTKIKLKYNGNIKKCLLTKNNILYTYLLEIYDIHILEYLSIIYQNNIDLKINNYLYNDYIRLYNNQSKSYNLKKNNKIFI